MTFAAIEAGVRRREFVPWDARNVPSVPGWRHTQLECDRFSPLCFAAMVGQQSAKQLLADKIGGPEEYNRAV